jgi:imidazolonepropionase-like amidohydrolase
MVVESNDLLQRGFTSIRDTAGPGFGIKKAVDEGLIPGPRMYLSGTLISQTSGHADRTLPFEEPRIFSGTVPVGEGVMKLDRVVNGPDEMLAAVRQNLKQGATQIKLALGGGVYSLYDPLDVTEFTAAEIKAAVDAASDWGTYVTAHLYQPKGILRGVRNGLKTIEHGQLMDEETAQAMAENGVYLITQPFEIEENLREIATDVQWNKYVQVVDGWQRTAELVKRYDVKMGFGTDLVFAPATNGQQADFLARFSPWFSNIEMLRMITSTNAEILALSGPRNPYQEDPLGVIEEGAYADIILVDGNPMEDVSILGNGGDNIPFVMKDGVVFKNTM